MDGGYGSNLGGITEHLVALTEPKLVRPRQWGIIGGAAVLILALFALAAVFSALFPVFFLLIAGVAYFAWYLWRFADVEYEYLIAQGEMSFSAVYGKKSRREIYSFPVKEMEALLSYGENRAECDAFTAAENRFYAGSYEDPDTLCALIRREDGTAVLLFFQGTPKAVDALRRANPRAVHVKL